MNFKHNLFNSVYAPGVSDPAFAPCGDVTVIWYDTAKEVFDAMNTPIALGSGFESLEQFYAQTEAIAHGEDGTIENVPHEVCIEAMASMGAWGWCDAKVRTLHLWACEGCEERVILELIAHELGHLTAKNVDGDAEEEMRADQYASVAVMATDIIASRFPKLGRVDGWHAPGLGEVHNQDHTALIFCTDGDENIDDQLAVRVRDALAAKDAGAHNWDIIQVFDNWLISEGILLTTHSEALHGPTAPALNWIASVKRMRDDSAKLGDIREAIAGYHLALDRREHGGVAAANAFAKVERVLGEGYEAGKALEAHEALKKARRALMDSAHGAPVFGPAVREAIAAINAIVGEAE